MPLMMGTHFLGKVPFKDRVSSTTACWTSRAAKNVQDQGQVWWIPSPWIRRVFGADGLAFHPGGWLRVQSRDNAHRPDRRVETNRNFATKLWNTSRFLRDEWPASPVPGFDPAGVKETVNQWIV